MKNILRVIHDLPGDPVNLASVRKPSGRAPLRGREYSYTRVPTGNRLHVTVLTFCWIRRLTSPFFQITWCRVDRTT